MDSRAVPVGSSTPARTPANTFPPQHFHPPFLPAPVPYIMKEAKRGDADFLADGFKTLRASGPPPDFNLVVDDKEWPVHKLVLYCQSDVLYRMSTSEGYVEARAGRLTLKEVDSRHVDVMVKYMYQEGYGCRIIGSGGPGVIDTDKNGHMYHEEADAGISMDFHMGVMILAEQYNVRGLKNAALNHIENILKESKYESKEFAKLVNRILDKDDLPDEVEAMAAKVASERIECLYSKDEAKLLKTRPEFAAEVLGLLVEERGMSRGKESQCQRECLV